MSKIQRFGISMPQDLLQAFDEEIANQGYANRSEAIRDIVRNHLVDRQWQDPQATVVGTITIVYDHSIRGLEERLVDIQHDDRYLHHISCTTHVHLDRDNCVEVMVVRGRAGDVRGLADSIISARGVKHGSLTCTGITPIKEHHHDADHQHSH
jgi:CopG family transcriptional regulator, nickel-responsive regulator